MISWLRILFWLEPSQYDLKQCADEFCRELEAFHVNNGDDWTMRENDAAYEGYMRGANNVLKSLKGEK